MRRTKWIGLALMLASAAPLHAQSVKTGIQAWQKAEYARAVAIWRPLAEKGDADAAFNLGQSYRLGRGVPTNLGAAQIWFERAARKGHLDAQTTLGLLLFQNGNRPGGLRWLRQAAAKADPRAMLVYGTALFNGDGIPRDPVLGYAFVSRAAAQGLAPARETLAQLDQILPLEDRKRALAMVIAKEKAAPAAASAPPKKPPSKPAQSASVKPPAKAASAPPPKVAPAAPATGAWRVQLGAFSKRASAEALYGRLSGSSALAGRRPFYIPVGAITRLQVGPFESRPAAQAACNALKGQGCFAVPAR